MKFGAIAPYAVGRVEDPEYAVRLATMLEAFGFESLWTVEHVIMNLAYESTYPYDPSGRTPFTPQVAQPDPLIWLSFVAQATSKIRLGTAVLNLPQRNPFVLAKEVATLDRLSGGRVELGIGVGWVREESEAIGVEWKGRDRRADEYLDIMRTLWLDDVSAHQGQLHDFKDVVSLPKPVQEGGPRIVVGGHSKTAARRAGRRASGFFPLGVSDDRLAELLVVMRGAAEGADRDPEAIELTLAGAPDRSEADRVSALGAARMVFGLHEGDLDKLEPQLEAFAKNVIEPLSQ